MSHYHILHVDDEESIRMVMSLDLKEEGYAVDSAGSGKEALEKLETSHYDLIITDLNMEGMNGIEVMQEAKKMKPEIMVMMLTAYGSLDSAVQALRLGASDYLFKPYDRSELFLRIKNCFEKLELQKKVTLYETILTMCTICRKIQDDTDAEPGEGKWTYPDIYLKERANVDNKKTFCPECFKDWKRQLAAD
ncbi:MAG: response regulator [Nitrospinae bacterium]|jgi:DNA-binding NtrC family response regulator|nr:response regulator [Nitrospinota bacterium]MDA1109119.1 response regulator [Nitrospinota bacterium]